MSEYQFIQNLEFKVLLLLLTGEDYYNTYEYEISVVDNVVHIGFNDVNKDYTLGFSYLKVLSVDNFDITVVLRDDIFNFNDRSMIEREELYRRLYAYKMHPVLKIIIMFLTDIRYPQPYLKLIPPKYIKEINEFIMSEN